LSAATRRPTLLVEAEQAYTMAMTYVETIEDSDRADTVYEYAAGQLDVYVRGRAYARGRGGGGHPHHHGRRG
jgi:hypothetical protein